MPKLTDQGFQHSGSIDPHILKGLNRIKKRVYVVGRFNNSDDTRGRLFAFGSKKLRDELEDIDDLEDVVIGCEPTGESFLDAVRPIVAEWIEEGFGPTVGTKFPTKLDRDLTGYREIAINAFMLMYDGEGSSLSPETGKRVLAQLENAADAYVSFAQSQSKLLAELNGLLYAFQKTNSFGYNPMIAKKGLAFPTSFQEALFQYLLDEDQKGEFNLEGIELPGKMTGATARKFVRAGVCDFRNQLMTSTEEKRSKSTRNKISEGVRNAFQEQRESIQRGVKLLQSRVMMGAIPTWQFFLLFGKHPDEIDHETDPSDLLDKLIGQSEDERRVKIGSKEVVLAKPIRQVSKAVGDKLTAGLHDSLPAALNAYANQENKGIVAFEKKLEKQGLDKEQIGAVSSRLNILHEICVKSAEGEDDAAAKKAKHKETADELIESFLDELDQDFIRFLIGSPVVTGEMFKRAYEKRCRSRYMRAISLVSGTTGKLQDVSLKERKRISDEIDKIEDELPSRIDRLLVKFLETASTKLTSAVADEYYAIGVKARNRANELWERSSRIDSGDAAHSKKTAARLTGLVDKPLNSLELVQHAELEMQQRADGTVETSTKSSAPKKKTAKKASAKPTKGSVKESREKSGESQQQSTFRDKLLNAARRNRATSEQSKEPKEEKLLEEGAEIIADHASNADKKIKEAREKKDKVFVRKDREIALREMAMSRSEDLYFGEEYSSLLDLALDAVACGSESPDEFFKKFPMSKYFPLEEVEQVRDWYLRLWHMLKESCIALEKHISEVRAFIGLIEKCSSALKKLDGGAELYLFNGSGSEFVSWVSEQGDENQLWLAEHVRESYFLAPTAVCILESALTNESRFTGDDEDFAEGVSTMVDGEIASNAASFLSAIKSAAEPADSKMNCPVILFGPCDPLGGRTRHWASNYEGIGAQIEESFNGLCYVVGPAIRRGKKQRAPLAEITVPMSLAVVEKILSHNCTYDEKPQKADRDELHRGFVNLASKNRPASDMIDSFCSDKSLFPTERNAQNFSSLRLALFAQYVQWLYDALHWDVKFDKETIPHFHAVFEHLTAESDFKTNQTTMRNSIADYLRVVGTDSDELQIDFERKAIAYYLSSTEAEEFTWLALGDLAKAQTSEEEG